MTFDIARYFTTEQPLPGVRTTGYDYVTAGNGLFKRARNRHLEATIPLARARVAGLPELYPYVKLTGHKLPDSLLDVALQDARRLARRKPIEAMYHLYVQDGQVKLARPRQSGTAADLKYAGGGDPHIICDLHSHCEMNAGFSITDDRDETGFRFYATMGRIFTRPELVVRLGIYGDFYSVPVVTLFTGTGPFVEGANGCKRISKSSHVTASKSGILSVYW